MINIADFEKVELRIGRIIEVNDVENARKPLYRLGIDLGELGSRQIVAGIKGQYAKEELLGKSIVCIVNLEPKTVAGIESQGMLLAAEDDSRLSLIIPERDVAAGSMVH